MADSAAGTYVLVALGFLVMGLAGGYLMFIDEESSSHRKDRERKAEIKKLDEKIKSANSHLAVQILCALGRPELEGRIRPLIC